MPCTVTVRGKKRCLASVMVRGKRKTRLYKDDSRRSFLSARIWEDEKREQMQTGMDELRLSDWMLDYLDEIQMRVIHKTYCHRRNIFNRFQLAVGNVPIEKISRKKIRDYVKTQRNRTGGARNDDLKELQTAWDWAMENIPYFPQHNPFKEIQRFPKDKKPRQVPSKNEFRLVYAAADHSQDKVILLTIYKTAARPIECFRLKFADIDFEKQKIQLWSRKGKNHNYSNRWVSMDDELKAVLETWIEKRSGVTGVTANENVFISMDVKNFGRPFRERRHFMRELCKKAGVKQFGLYGLRHLRAAIVYNESENIHKVQRLLGHTKASTTDNYLTEYGLDVLEIE